jgi:putative DNA primase/helicase
MITALDLATRLGLKRYPRTFRGRCPACDYPGATFSVREGRDGRVLLWCANGCNHDHLADAVKCIMGGSWTPLERPSAENEAAARERKQGAALGLWRGSTRGAGTIIELYLTARGLPGLASSPALRFRGDCHHPAGGWLPAMVAIVTDVTGRPVGVHRTYLTCDGSGKATVAPNKATLGPCWGGAARLDLVAPELVIGEGIESSGSAGQLLGLPAWAAIGAGNLAAGLRLPPEVRSIIIAADNDTPTRGGRRPGQEAAEAAARRWRAEGRRVRIARPNCEGRDFNDLLLERLHA